MNDSYERGPAGPDPYDPKVRRRNVLTLLAVVVVLVAAALVPMTVRHFQQPEELYPTYQAAADAGAVKTGGLPAFVPAGARQIYTRQNRNTGRRFVRFDYAPADLPAITRGMRPVTGAEVEKVTVPTPGWSRWWPLSSRTFSGTQGEHLLVFEVPAGPDRGYLAVDPRTLHAYFWSR